MAPARPGPRVQAPIAVVGRSCLLPGALSPEQLGDAVFAQRDLLGSTPPDRWGVSWEAIRCAAPGSPGRQHTGDRCWADRGGYVQGWEAAWQPEGFALPAELLSGLDPVFLWPLHTARQALEGVTLPPPERRASWLGNLGFPTVGLSRWAERTWLESLAGFGSQAADAAGIPLADPRNRFMGGGPAALLAGALELQAGSLALDAACASSLYALALACEALQDGRVDLALAGAVQRSDDLFIHVGFCALQAMSRTGQSRPFHAGADGLVPAEGAGFLALKRLEDALRDGDPVHAVVRGVGLSNDGRGRGLLAPAVEGQVRAMQAAWAAAGLDPATCTQVECHATGTSVGDGAELSSMGQVFQGSRGLPIGSLKGNLGHLVTAAGVAGTIKIMEGMRRGLRPPNRPVEELHPGLEGAPFRVLQQVEEWSGPRRAAVSAFGFGGNNAHVVLDQLPEPGWEPALPAPPPAAELAVVALGARVGSADDASQWAEALASGAGIATAIDTVKLGLKGLRFPPKDLQETLAQQLLLLEAARTAVAGLAAPLPRDRTSVLVGIEPDPEVARYGLRWRLAEWARAWGAGPDWVDQAREAVVAELTSAGVLGTMPNIPANRLNSQLDVAGPSYVVFAAEGSGLAALHLAARELREGKVDAAVVGACDLSWEPAHQAAARWALPPEQQQPGDAAVALVLMRRSDAEARGERILALLPGTPVQPELRLGLAPGAHSLVPTHGHAHAAAGMVHLGAAVLCLATGVRPDGGSAPAASAEVSAPGAAVVGLIAPPVPVSLSPRVVDGPVLELAAHLPPVSLPPLPRPLQAAPVEVPVPPSEETPAPVGAQTMAPAPALAPVLGAPPVDLSPPLVPRASANAQLTAPGASGVNAQLKAPGAWGGPSGKASLEGTMLQQSQLVQDAHAAFLARQAQVHRQFLETRQNALFALLQASGGLAHLPQAAPAPAPRPPAAAPPATLAPQPSAAPPQPKPHTPAAPPQPVPAPGAASPPAPASKPATTSGIPAGPVPGELKRTPTGFTLDRAGLLVHASGNISEIYGEIFEPQDQYDRVCRMPEPPLLLADRMTGIDAEPGSMGQGTIWTETDVQVDSWYLNEGRMPSGIMIESGQADLMLISYLGIDLLNKGERVYRLLGCQLTYHRDLPRPGETLQYDIHVDGHAKHGDVRLFFFHYDCVIDGQPALTVRQGQAGFFTEQELADSAGILWTPQEQEIVSEPRLDAPELQCSKRSFSGEEIAAFAAGRGWECFGPDFYWLQTHNRPPAIQQGPMLFLHEIPVFEPRGGPWGRGYLRAVQHLADDDWFYQGHFKNDPCMPGTLMFEGCVQAMSFYLAAMGVTAKRDGWRFQPVKGELFDLKCRGQAIPGNRELVYEVFVEEFVAGPVPTLYADLLCTIDGLKAFHARRVGIELVPDWPITSKPELWGSDAVPPDSLRSPASQGGPVPPGAPADHASRQVATLDGFPLDYKSLLACAWNKPSLAFGPMYSRFDGHRKVARLPGPPYHFMSRVTRVDGPPPVTRVGGKLQPGCEIELEFDVDPAAWYFAENGAATMPFCVFLEAALQPCGWLASYVGSALTVDRDLMFRNLDGTATWTGELFRDAGTLTTRVKITTISTTAGMIIEGFDVGCFLTDLDGTERQVYTMKTVFGFFPKEALENQVGLPTNDEQRAFLEAESAYLCDLTLRPDRFCAGAPRLATPMLLMIDRITGWWPEGGEAGLGRVRGEKEVDPSEWFFKAHFFQDPVQPGSLGLEALLQLLQWVMLERGMGQGMANPRFEPLMQGRELVWKYRGQVVPHNTLISSTMEITEVGEDELGPYVIGTGSLWVDGKRIYEVFEMGMRIVDDLPPTEEEARSRRAYFQPPAPEPATDSVGDLLWPEARDQLQVQADPSSTEAVAEGLAAEIHLDPGVDTWIGDHCPTWTVPSLPMMVVAELLTRPVVQAGRQVNGLAEVKVKRWITVTGPLELVATVVASREGAATVQLADSQGVLASGQVRFGPFPQAPRPRSSLSGKEEGNLYEQGHLFHGPAFHLLKRLVLSDSGASATLSLPAGAPRAGALSAALLDGATHPIPHDRLDRWYDELGPDTVAYPALLQQLTLFGPTPSASTPVRCEVRPAGNLGAPDLPVFDIELSTVDGVWATLRLVEACFPKGPLGRAAPADRLAFLRDGRFVPGVRLSRVADDGSSHLAEAEVEASDWLPGTVQAIYGSRDPAEILRREHLAHHVGVHPRVVDAALPLNEILVELSEGEGEHTARLGGIEKLDLSPIQDFWAEWFAMGRRWPVEDLYYGLMRRFLRRVVLTDPVAAATVHGQPVVYLANHQVGVESLLFSILASGLNRVPTCTVAKIEHQDTWLGNLIRLCFAYPGVLDPKVITYFDRTDKASLVGIIRELATGLVTQQVGRGGATAPGQSVMVHIEGTRSLECRTPVQKMSGAFIDMALETGRPIVPVRFTGGLPAEPLDQRIEYPFGLGTQDVWLGRPLLPEELRAVPYGERKKRVIGAINGLGPANASEEAHEGDEYLEQAARAWMDHSGASHEHAVLYQVLEQQGDLCEDSLWLLDRIARGELIEGDEPEAAWLRRLRALLDPRGAG